MSLGTQEYGQILDLTAEPFQGLQSVSNPGLRAKPPLVHKFMSIPVPETPLSLNSQKQRIVNVMPPNPLDPNIWPQLA